MLNTLTFLPRHLLTLLDTVVHEVGHTVALLPIGTTLSIRVHADGTGSTHGSMGVLGDGWLGVPHRIINLFAGYAAPLLFGLFIALTAWRENVTVSGWWAVVGVLWLIAAVLLTVRTHTVGALVLFASWVGVVLALFHAPGPVSTVALSGADLTLWLLSYVGAVIVLACRSLFTVVAAALWITVVWLLSLPLNNPDTQQLGAVLLTSFGVVIFLTGLWTLIAIAPSVLGGGESDFHLLTQQFGGSPLGWFIVFSILCTTSLIVLTIAVLSGVIV